MSLQRMKRWSNSFMERIQILSMNSYNLAMTTFNKEHNGNFRNALLTEARRNDNPNNLAISILHIQKEIGFVQYYGIGRYIQEKNPNLNMKRLLSTIYPSSSSIKNDVTQKSIEDNSNNTSKNRTIVRTPTTKAKVAFMITATMKNELIDKLGYSPDRIKRMKPIEASLILQHNVKYSIPPTTTNTIGEKQQEEGDSDSKKETINGNDNNHIFCSETRLQELVAEYNEQIEIERKLQQEQIITQQEQQQQHQQRINEEKGEENKNIWYEVVETYITKDGTSSTSIVGTYKHEKDAKLCVDIKEEIALKRSSSPSSKEQGKTETMLSSSSNSSSYNALLPQKQVTSPLSSPTTSSTEVVGTKEENVAQQEELEESRTSSTIQPTKTYVVRRTLK